MTSGSGPGRLKPRGPGGVAIELRPGADHDPNLPAIPGVLRSLQAAAGNSAVSRALARCVGTCTCGGRCEEDVGPWTAMLARAAATAETSSARLLRRGSRGEGVMSVQERLNLLGAVPALDVDGIFGAQTDMAVRFFQESHRLVVDGLVGPETNAMLDRETARHGSLDEVAGRGGAPCHTPEAPGPDDVATGEVRPRALPDIADKHLPSSLRGFQARGGSKAKDAPPAPKAPPAAPDLVVQLTDEAPPGPGQDDTQVSQALAQANAGGAQPVKVASPEQLRDLLKSRGTVGRLIVISHGFTTGEVRFDLQGMRDVKLADLAAELQKSGATVREIVFRGCSIGNDRQGLESMRKALNSNLAEGTNCHLESKRAGPVIILAPPSKKGGQPQRIVVTSEAAFQALHPNDKPVYHRTLRNLLASAGHADCLVGLAQGKKAASLSDDELRALAMRNRGRLVVQYTKESDECFTDLQFGGSGQCRRIQAVAPTPP
jgi:Putative peptidoglycan binding domain